MTTEMILPTLRKKIFRHYAAIVGLFGVVGALLVIVAVFVATGLAPKALHRNYDSIEAARKMQEAWDALSHPEEFADFPKVKWEQQFETALNFELGNITEPNEKELAKEISALWAERKQGKFSNIATRAFHEKIEKLVVINEEGMFGYVSEGLALRRNVVIIAFVLFFFVLMITLVIADNLAGRLALPLRAIAEALRSKPQTGRPLKLPTPTSLEIKILSEELTSMWRRIGRVDQLNVEEIERQRKSLLTLLTAVEDAILVLDAGDVITHVSPRMVEIIGIAEADIVGQPWGDLPALSDNYLKLREILSTDLPDSSSFELKADFGKTRVFAARTRLVQGPSGKSSKIFLLHDITEVKQRERLKAEFIGVLSHELKTPLQSLSTASDLLCQEKERMDERMKLLAETIAEDVARIRGVANEFVQVSQFTGGSIRVRPQNADLAELLPVWMKPFQVVAKERGVVIELVKESEGSIFARVDSVRFPWVVSNLLSNAVRVSPKGGKVEVRLTERAGACEIEFRDAGPGISEEVQRRMFDPYFQGSADAPKLSGTMGMGLTIAKEITEAHNGKLEYAKIDPEGSIFRVILPR